MRKNILKDCFSSDKTAHGLFCTLYEPAIIEMIGATGYDFVILDMEHSSLNFSKVENLVRTGELANLTSIVRVPKNSPDDFLRAADIGAQGVLVTHVCTVDEVHELINAIKFPPIGNRGMSGVSRAAKYSDTDIDDHMRIANDEVLAMIMIEDKEAVENLDKILEVEGLDMIFIGPADLSRDYGVPGQMDHPKVKEVIEYIFEVAKKFPKVKVGIPAFQINDVPKRVQEGANMITSPPSDVKLIYTSLKESLEEIKEKL